MNDVVAVSTALLRKFADFVKTLSADELARVSSGELKFELVERAARKTAPAKAQVDVGRVRDDLRSMSTREAAASYIESLRLNADPLKDLARALGASLVGVSRKDDVRDRIVEHTVGYRLNSAAIRDGA